MSFISLVSFAYSKYFYFTFLNVKKRKIQYNFLEIEKFLDKENERMTQTM